MMVMMAVRVSESEILINTGVVYVFLATAAALYYSSTIIRS